jgi:hypothetical protein
MLQPRDAHPCAVRSKNCIHAIFALQTSSNLGALVKAHKVGSGFIAIYFLVIKTTVE